MSIEPMAGWPEGKEGNSFCRRGFRKAVHTRRKPLCSPIFIIPSQKAMTPTRPSEISNARRDMLKTDSINRTNTCVSPFISSCSRAETKAIKKKLAQILFNTGGFRKV